MGEFGWGSGFVASRASDSGHLQGPHADRLKTFQTLSRDTGMNASADTFSADENAYLQYRALSMAGVFALLFGLLSLPALAFAGLLFVAAFGVAWGLFAVLRIAKRRDELTGYGLAVAGLALSGLALLGGAARAGYEAATEVPENCQPITFEMLQPDERTPQLPIPASAVQLDGQRIFVKGYVHPGVDRQTGIKQFILVPDMKTCCFGGQPALTDMIQVQLKDPLRIDYSISRRKLAGVLRVSPYKKPVSGLDGVYYQLEADYLK